MYLYPKTLKKGKLLGNIDIAVRKPVADEKPTEAHIIFIEEGEAHYGISISPQSSNGRFKTQFTIGDADLVAIEFDAEWRLNQMKKHRPVTLSEPWLIRVTGGKLLAQKGETFTPLELDSGNITSLRAVRSWQNTITPSDDHGLVILYVKDGKPHYVNYSQQLEGFKEWSLPVVIPGFNNVTSISGFRSNDYRLIVLVEEAGVIHKIVSTRNWSGMAIPAENIYAGVESIKLTFTELQYNNRYEKDKSLVYVKPRATVDLGLITVTNAFLSAYNPDPFTVIVKLANTIYNVDPQNFIIKDSKDRSFRIESLVYNKLDPTITFKMEDFNNARGALTVLYTSQGTTTNIKGEKFTPFNISFDPTGLEPVDIPLPKVISITNVEG